MAYVGLRKPIIAKRTGKGKYEDAITFGKAVGVNVTPNYAEGSLNADDEQAEYDKEFNYADVTLNTSTIPLEGQEAMFGHTVEEAKRNVKFNISDQAGYAGVAWLSVEKIDGTRYYVGNFLPKVKFSEPSEEYSTKGDSIEYKTPSISGRAFAEDDGMWKEIQKFDTEEEALAWCNGKFTGVNPASLEYGEE